MTTGGTGGSSIVFRIGDYLMESFLQAPFYHILVEGFLIVVVIWLIKRKRRKPEINPLSQEEEEEIIRGWKPKPLVDLEDEDLEEEELNVWGAVEGRPGKFVDVEGVKYLNLATHNYLGFVDEQTIDDEAERCIKKYGVGSCGPRGFYGTVDVHLELEEKIAKFMNCEETALYSYGFSTIASAIPSYAKSGDIIFADEQVNFAIQKGLQASRSQIIYFKHNDHNDLLNHLEEQTHRLAKNPKKAKTVKKFCVVEGIYMKTGEMCPLKEIASMCLDHKVRLYVDEAVSFGVIGSTGRGVTEYLNVPIEDIDFISGSLENAMAAFGGFIVGPSFVVDHQRISGLGYCFSASLPPLLAGAGIQALKLIEDHPEFIEDLQNKCLIMHKVLGQLKEFKLGGHELSPIKFIYLRKSLESRKVEKNILRQIILHIKEHYRIALVQPCYLERDEYLLPPASIRIAINRLLTQNEIQKLGEALSSAAKAIGL